MSKEIPKPIITIGYSTKKATSGKLVYGIDGNKLKKMDVLQVGEIIAMFSDIQREIIGVSGSKLSVKPDHPILTSDQYNTIERYIRGGKLLMGVKLYKEYTGVGLKEAKEAVELIRDNSLNLRNNENNFK